PITITSANHGLQNGQRVTIAGVVGFGAANGTFTIANVTTNTFDLVGTSGNGAGAGGTWTIPNDMSTAANSPYLVDGNPTRLALGDVDQDGVLDVVTAGSTGNEFSLLYGDKTSTGPTASFRTATRISLGGATGQADVVTGDLNLDGLPDIVIANSN